LLRKKPALAARHLDPRNPPPTAFQSANRTIWIIVSLVIVQGILNGLEFLVPAQTMVITWWSYALIAGVATYQIERFFARRGRL
jgi:hypothetical protein